VLWCIVAEALAALASRLVGHALVEAIAWFPVTEFIPAVIWMAPVTRGPRHATESMIMNLISRGTRGRAFGGIVGHGRGPRRRSQHKRTGRANAD
jgi:hypothetical protein